MTGWTTKSVGTGAGAQALADLQATTPARIGVGRAGVRPCTDAWLQFRRDHALAKDAVKGEFSQEFLRLMKERGYPIIQSQAPDKPGFILRPPDGKRTDSSNIDVLRKTCAQNRDVQIVISDGLSARAVESNIEDVLPMIIEGLQLEGFTCGTPVVVRFGRVAIADQITDALGAKLAINLIGERPGLSAADSMSAYLTYGAGPDTISSDRTVVSNIHGRGTLPVEAGAYIVQLAKRILQLKISGVKLQQIS
jgi:ethanolamine ammonia-lyase small subunit